MKQKKQLAQAQLIIVGIKNRTRVTKATLLDNDYQRAQEELKGRFELATTTLKNRERLIFSEIKKNLSLLVLKEVLVEEEDSRQSSPDLSEAYMKRSIKKFCNNFSGMKV